MKISKKNLVVSLPQVLLFAFCFVLLWASLGLAASVQVLFSTTTSTGGPFPNDLFTVSDATHQTGLRINLPKPNCSLRPSDCADLDVINALDGFNLQPRLSIPFSGAINLSTATSATIFLVKLGESTSGSPVIGINQAVWDPTTKRLAVESDALLEQHTRYALIVTMGVHDLVGSPVLASSAFRQFLSKPTTQIKDLRLRAYQAALLSAQTAAGKAGVRVSDIIAISVFTTQSTTATLEKIRDQLKAAVPPSADFLLGPGGLQTVFALDTVTDVTFNRQVSTAPTFTTSHVPVSSGLFFFPGVLGQIAFGKYRSPNYQTSQGIIPVVGTLSGSPQLQGENDIFFDLFLPSGLQPAAGWPVAIFGHGLEGSKSSLYSVAAAMAAHGIATIAINVVGHGSGPLSTYAVSRTNGTAVTFSAGGRGIDQNGDGKIRHSEGLNAMPPWTIIDTRDSQRQTVVDLMQLVRVIEGGMDVTGDGSADLDPSRIYYFGQSLGGMYGGMFVAIEPNVQAGVLNVGGGPFIEVTRLSPYLRPLVVVNLYLRVPSLLNVSAPTYFNENLPLRDQPPVTNTVQGAIAIQEFIDNSEWVSQSGDVVAYAPHLRKQPLNGSAPKQVIIQFAKGDQVVPNPTTTAVLRAGDLAAYATFFRNDLAYAANPYFLKNPHVFLTTPVATIPDMAEVALGAQEQIAVFFASHGSTIVDPDAAGPWFEVPISLPLPEALYFLP